MKFAYYIPVSIKQFAESEFRKIEYIEDLINLTTSAFESTYGRQGIEITNPHADYVARMKRLLTEDRQDIAEAFHYLLLACKTETQLCRFVQAACRSGPTEQHRINIKEATLARRNVARLAEELSSALIALMVTDIEWPKEFNIAPAPKAIPKRPLPDQYRAATHRFRDKYRNMKDERLTFLAQQILERMETVGALKRMAKVAQSNLLLPRGANHAAALNRQKNAKTAYLRALWHSLHVDFGFTRSTNLVHAIAITATVMLDDPDLTVTYEDVSKLIDRFEGAQKKTRHAK